MNFKKTRTASIIFIVLVILMFFIFVADISPNEEKEIFVVPQNSTSTEYIVNKLSDQSFISSNWLFNSILSITGLKEIKSGGYLINKGTSLFNIVGILSNEPELAWISIPEGLRKEEIAEIISKKLNWSTKQKNRFLNAHNNDDYKEGVYFPETYLVPKKESGADMAERMISKFNEKFKTLSQDFKKENLKWTTGLKLASIVQREASNEKEMPLVAGILWNRLLDDMKLQVDASLQYAVGKTEEGWWEPVEAETKEIDSLYNTYKYKGLPPTPICNPGLSAIKSALNPKETDCIYYIHSDNKIYCSDNYDKHLENINRYLK